jgi:5-keto 4-deoxyuronate isomerase
MRFLIGLFLAGSVFAADGKPVFAFNKADGTVTVTVVLDIKTECQNSKIRIAGHAPEKQAAAAASEQISLKQFVLQKVQAICQAAVGSLSYTDAQIDAEKTKVNAQYEALKVFRPTGDIDPTKVEDAP